MRIVLQRVTKGQVTSKGQTLGEINQGYVLLVAAGKNDTSEDAAYLAGKISRLRVFEDASGKMNRSIHEIGGKILSISQFTLYANTRKGNRPSFINAAPPAEAKALYEHFNELLRQHGLLVETGEFGAEMKIELINDGPVTIIFDSEDHS